MAALRAGVSTLAVHPLLTICNALQGSRARRARYWLYLKAPDHFAADWFIQNEVGFLQCNFTRYTWQAYAALRWSEPNLPLNELLARAQPDPFSTAEAQLVAEMFAIAERSKEPAGSPGATRGRRPLCGLLRRVGQDLLRCSPQDVIRVVRCVLRGAYSVLCAIAKWEIRNTFHALRRAAKRKSIPVIKPVREHHGLLLRYHL